MLGNSVIDVHSLPEPRNEALLKVVDILFTTLVAGPLVIIYWVATWTLMDLYIYPEDPLLSYECCVAFGITFGLALCALQMPLSNMVTPKIGRVKYFLLTRLYTAFAAVVNVASCRGVWSLLDFFIPDTRDVIVSTVMATVALALSRSLRNLDSAPCVLVLDSEEGYFESPTFYKTVCLHFFKSLFVLE